MTQAAGAFLRGVGTAVPGTRYTQRECWQAFRAAPQFEALRGPSRVLLERVLLADNGIRTRHLALDSLAEVFALDPDVMHRRFARHAPALAASAARRALARSGLAAKQVDALLVSTCTGMLCPGLTSYVAEALGLRPDIAALDLVGQGCGAALPNLRTASALLASGESANALCVCVEVCSAALYIDDDPGVLVSACLFGDGAAAVVLSSEPGVRRAQWVEGFSIANAAERETLRMETRGGLLRNILSRQVPAIAAEHASRLLAEALGRHGLGQRDIAAWVLHAGGKSVLARLRQEMALEENHTGQSARVLEAFGNLSSPFVLFVLQAALEQERPGWWWMSSFGAGFSCHGALLRVD